MNKVHPGIWLYGGGGHAKVVIGMARASGKHIYGVFDDDISHPGIEDLKIYRFDISIINDGDMICISIGDNHDRKDVARRIHGNFATIIHPQAILSQDREIGEGSVVMQQAVIQPATVIGKHCIINTSCIIEHDCLIGDFTHIGPGAIICGNCRIGEGVLIGAGSVILPGISVGRWSIIGAGAVVTKNVDDQTVCTGNPARIIKKNVVEE